MKNATQEPEVQRILVVDDDKMMRGILAEILTNCGYEVVVASNGAEALQHLEAQDFSLVVTDLLMPEMSGLDLLRKAKTLHEGLDMIVITASHEVSNAIESMKAGAADYIVKPFHLDQIRIVVARTLEMRRLKEQARKVDFYKTLAERDGLTGLLNHRTFQELLRHECQRSMRYERRLSLLMLDVDHFKKLNDSCGHPTGDRVLEQLARLLEENCRNPDHQCRYGGEEFSIIAPETDKFGAMHLAERIRNAVEIKAFPGEERLPAGRLTLSVGLATYPVDSPDPVRLIDSADQALLEAKSRGRNRVVAFHPARPRQEWPESQGETGQAPERA